MNLGWYWIPRVHWGPAWVHWYWDRNYVGWCPLSYYDRPGVLVDNRFYDRYRDSYYPMNSRALTMIHRDQLQSPAISRRALAASQFNALGKISLRAEQPAIRPVIPSSALRSPGSGKTLNGSGSGAIRSYGTNSASPIGGPSPVLPLRRSRIIKKSFRRSTSGPLTSSSASPGSCGAPGPARPEDLSKLFLKRTPPQHAKH